MSSLRNTAKGFPISLTGLVLPYRLQDKERLVHNAHPRINRRVSKNKMCSLPQMEKIIAERPLLHAAPPPATSLFLQVRQTSSNPPITSPQTLLHSLSPNFLSQPPCSIHLTASSLDSISLRISTTMSRAALSFRAADVVVWRVMYIVSER